MYDSVALSTFTMLCHYHHCLVPKHVRHPKRQSCLITSASSVPAAPGPLATLHLPSASASVALPILNISYKWNHTIRVLLYLVSLT